MIFNKVFQVLRLRSTVSILSRCYLSSQKVSNSLPVFQQFINNSWIYQQNHTIKLPVENNSNIGNNIIDLPNGLRWLPPLIEPESTKNEIEEPSNVNEISKEAARLIVIRRKKMKKHKLKKLRKRMKFEWRKLRQRRELKKEKAFQAVLIQQCKEAEAFSAEQYVQERIGKLNEIVIPRYWKGRRLPEFLIREKMGLPPK